MTLYSTNYLYSGFEPFTVTILACEQARAKKKSASEASRRVGNKLRRAKRAKYDGFPPQNPAFFFRPITDYNPIRSLFTGYGNFTLQNLLASPS